MYLTDYGFSFGIAITDVFGRPFTLDPTYFTLEIAQGTFIKNGGYYYPSYTDLGYKLWDANDYSNQNTEFIARILSSSLYCPKNKRYKVAGNYLSNRLKSHYEFFNTIYSSKYKMK